MENADAIATTITAATGPGVDARLFCSECEARMPVPDFAAWMLEQGPRFADAVGGGQAFRDARVDAPSGQPAAYFAGRG